MSWGIPTVASLISFKGSNFNKGKEILVFKNEDELRAIWSKPDTRKKLLQELFLNHLIAKVMTIKTQRMKFVITVDLVKPLQKETH